MEMREKLSKLKDAAENAGTASPVLLWDMSSRLQRLTVASVMPVYLQQLFPAAPADMGIPVERQMKTHIIYQTAFWQPAAQGLAPD